MFTDRQSSETVLIGEALKMGQEGPKAVALNVVTFRDDFGTGGANRKDPSGASAKGIPKKTSCLRLGKEIPLTFVSPS